MTTTAMTRCACCQVPRPLPELYEPVPGLGEYRCRDTAGCRRRAAYVGDPVGQIAAAPPPAVPGARCSVCGGSGVPVYERTPGVFACLDRAGCDSRAVGHLYLRSWADTSDDMLATAAGMRAAQAAAGAEIPPERAEPGPAELAALAAADALGRKRQ